MKKLFLLLSMTFAFQHALAVPFEATPPTHLDPAPEQQEEVIVIPDKDGGEVLVFPELDAFIHFYHDGWIRICFGRDCYDFPPPGHVDEDNKNLA